MNNFEKGKELEDKTANILDAVGVKNNKNSGPGDGGIDISGEAASHEFAIQCKNWANKIGRSIAESLQGCSSDVNTMEKSVSWWRPPDIYPEQKAGRVHGIILTN
ncbi:8361_t:CDS:2, partial [Funneliformis caledonium]